MPLHGKSLIAGTLATSQGATFQPTSPLDSRLLEPVFHEASSDDADRALHHANEAFGHFRRVPAETRAAFLEAIATELLALGDELLERAHRETGLPLARLTGERGRTVAQLRLFAEVAREGSWCDARIDTAQPERQPLPRPDLRRMLIPIGPVIVFGASNFPFAFSTAGGDTASAFAAGCPVVVKAHPAHPGTSELTAGAIARAAASCALPAGIFSHLHGGAELSIALVEHPLARAVGFTGSRTAGLALLRAAQNRPELIPVFAEMSSLNPLFILPGAMRENAAQIVAGLTASVNLGVGQFCTKPGLICGLASAEFNAFAESFTEDIAATPPATMLHRRIRDAYHAGLNAMEGIRGVRPIAISSTLPESAPTQAGAVVFATDADNFLLHRALHEEVFGPYTLLVTARSWTELEAVARSLEGQLTATVHATPQDLAVAADLLALLERKCGRLVLNGFPTGVEVSPAMQHGGPFPATTDAHFTSVGTAALLRFARPLCLQNFPAAALPPELQNENPRGLLRQVDGRSTRDRL